MLYTVRKTSEYSAVFNYTVAHSVLPYVPKGATIKFFYKYFVLGFLTHIKYNYSIENWVWLCMLGISGWGSNSGFCRCSLQPDLLYKVKYY